MEKKNKEYSGIILKVFQPQHDKTIPGQQGMSGQHRADSDTTWQRRIAVGPMLARLFMLAGLASHEKEP